MLQLFKNAHYNFVGRRYFIFAISAILILITIISLIVHGGLKYGVDFTGGTLLELKFQSPINTEVLRSAFGNLGMENVSIQKFGEANDFIVRFESQEMSASAESASTQITQKLQQEIPNNPAQLSRVEMVGPRIGKELQRNALLAIVIGMIGILIYVSIRFDFKFGFACVAALVHDIVISIGFISIVNIEMSIAIIAALLTIVGFSVNNSIVISDRVRENLRKLQKLSFNDLVNEAINSTMARTILTDFTIFLVSITLYILGAASIKQFALVISFGIFVGTYSAIFIGGPLVAEWEKRFPSRRRR
jgi:preprotein translocase subunit SecF